MALLDITAIQVGEEAVFNVEVAAFSDWPGIIRSANPIIKKDELMITDIGSQEEALLACHGKAEYGWEIEFEVTSWIFLFWVLGTLTSEVGVAPTTHTINPNNTIPSLSLEMVFGDGDFSVKFTGSKIDTCDITMVDGETTIRCKIIAKAALAVVDTTPGTPTLVTDTPYKVHNTSTLTINGKTYTNIVERAEYSLTRNPNANGSLSSQDPTTVTEGKRGWTAIYDIRFPSAAGDGEEGLNLLLNETEFVISHIVQRGGASDQITFTIPKAKNFEYNQKSGGGENARVETLPVRIINGLTLIPVDAIATYSDPQ